MKNTKQVKKLKSKIALIFGLVIFLTTLFTYIMIPISLNYPPFAENDIAFQNEIEKLNHPQQYIVFFLVATFTFYLIIHKLMKNIFSFLNQYYRKQKLTEDVLKKVRKDCVNIPYIFYLSEIIGVLTIALFIILSFGLRFSNTLIVKFALIIFTLISFISLLQFMFLQSTFKNIIKLTYTVNRPPEKMDGFRIKFSTNLMIQLMPFLTSSLIIISLIGYAKTTSEKSNTIMNYYKAYFDNRTFDTISMEDLKSELDTIPLYDKSDYYIIIPPNKDNIYTSNNSQISDFFLKYFEHYFYKTNGMVHEYYGTEQQAYMIELKDQNNDNWYIGFEYSSSDYELLLFYIGIIIIITEIYIIFIYIWSRNTSTNISTISQSLEHIIEENDYTSKTFLPILSNDEFGDLAYSYNKIEELTNLHLKEIQNNQDILVEQERLASLGQMIGGIAHNLKTPIFSVAGGLEGLSDLINEYDASIEAPSVTNEDMHDIAKDMREWIEKLKGHISYMSDVITTVKGQTTTLADNAIVDFSITELFKRVDILMKHEIKNALATLKIENNVGDADLLSGNINSLVQIINNIISNSIEAYSNQYKDKKIELTAIQNNHNIIISVKDYGPGISPTAQEKLFKEMITTKGKNGTGLGMFMSYSNIKAHFNGDLTYETELGKGTTFYITLPIKN